MRAARSILLVSLLSLPACRSALTGPWPPVESGVQEYRVGSGDIIRIAVFGNAELASRVTVRPDGRITLPLLNEVTVAGKRVAGALFLETDQALYGRYWGTDVHIDLLHFETAYYAGIDRAIARANPSGIATACPDHR